MLGCCWLGWLSLSHAQLIKEPLAPPLTGVTVPERAHELRKRWAPLGDSGFVVYESSSSQLAIGFDILDIRKPDQESESGIPSYKTPPHFEPRARQPGPQKLSGRLFGKAHRKLNRRLRRLFLQPYHPNTPQKER